MELTVTVIETGCDCPPEVRYQAVAGLLAEGGMDVFQSPSVAPCSGVLRPAAGFVRLFESTLKTEAAVASGSLSSAPKRGRTRHDRR